MNKGRVAFIGVFLAVVSLCLASSPLEQQASRLATPSLPQRSLPQLTAASFELPLYFCPNRGQIDDRVDFIVQGRDQVLYFTSEGVTFVLTESGKNGEMDAARWVVKLDFVDANKNISPAGEGETGAVISYFKGKREDWRAGLPTYSRIVYHDLWPGIDLAYSGTRDRLKYELIVRPGADPADIRLAYRGADRVAVDREGRLEVITPVRRFHDGAPLAYQESGEGKRPVSVAYKVEGCSYGFEVGEYDRDLPLILDPFIRMYSGYIGGSAADVAYGIAVDSSGNAYVTGYTASSEVTFPETVGPDLTFNVGAADAFVAKVDAAGTSLIYCGYIGGANDDRGRGIAVDAAGNAYVVGYTNSLESSFPVLNGPDLYYGGGTWDGFVARVNSSGVMLDYCGYIGGMGSDQALAVAADASGNAYITGSTDSTPPNFPAKVGPDISHNGLLDAFVGKINPGGTTIIYLGYLGGSSDDIGRGIAVDRTGNAYITGSTVSTQTTFPVLVGPDLTFNSGTSDAFVAKVNTGGTALDYCGYIGGSGEDVGQGISVDNWGCAYVTGHTTSTASTFPETVGPDLTHNGNYDAFIAKVRADGVSLTYCGYIGGSGADYGYGIVVDDAGIAHIAGSTDSTETNFPVKIGPDLTQNGGTDAFIAKVTALGVNLSLCGFIGGSGTDVAYSIATDRKGNVFLDGSTASSQTTFPVLVGPDLTYNSATDAFVTRFYSYDLPSRNHCAGDFDGDGFDELVIDFGASGLYMWDNGSWVLLVAANAEGVIAVDLDGDADDELVADLGTNGFWVWNSGNWGQLSGVNAEVIVPANLDGDADIEMAVSFGSAGLWLLDGTSWTQLSGASAEYMIAGNLDGSGSEEIVVDFGTLGMWVWNGGTWDQLSGVNPDYMLAGNVDGSGGEDLLGDFGPTGMWLFSGGSWTQLSNVNADYLILTDADHSGDDELFGDFAFTGLWKYDGGVWDNLSGLNMDYMVAADTNGDGAFGLAVDFGTLGLWLWDAGTWTQISGTNAEYLLAADIDGNGTDEIFGDFGSLGLWMWNSGVWSQISSSNPE